MKGFRAIWRSIAALFSRGFRPWSRTSKHSDPILADPHHRKHTRSSTKRFSHRKGPPRLGRPPCEPGTITYHDKLVRHFGRREADRIGRLIQARKMDGLPFTEQRKEAA